MLYPIQLRPIVALENYQTNLAILLLTTATMAKRTKSLGRVCYSGGGGGHSVVWRAKERARVRDSGLDMDGGVEEVSVCGSGLAPEKGSICGGEDCKMIKRRG